MESRLVLHRFIDGSIIADWVMHVKCVTRWHVTSMFMWASSESPRSLPSLNFCFRTDCAHHDPLPASISIGNFLSSVMVFHALPFVTCVRTLPCMLTEVGVDILPVPFWLLLRSVSLQLGQWTSQSLDSGVFLLSLFTFGPSSSLCLSVYPPQRIPTFIFDLSMLPLFLLWTSSRSMEKLWGFFKHCTWCWCKLAPSVSHSLCLLYLGKVHWTESCSHCLTFSKQTRKKLGCVAPCGSFGIHLEFNQDGIPILFSATDHQIDIETFSIGSTTKCIEDTFRSWAININPFRTSS